jgi:molecular chaperone GrpE
VSKHSSHHHEPAKHPAEDPAAPQSPPQTDQKPQTGTEPTPQVEMPPEKDGTLAKLQADLAAAKDRELRCRAELDNFRKRAARELDDQIRYASLSLLRDLLPVLDDVERALQAAEKNADAGALLEGFKMTAQQLADVLKRHQCQPIEALHLPFNPHVHHAILQQPSDEYPANTVLMVTQTGYQLHDRVVRPSQVIVSSAK